MPFFLVELSFDFVYLNSTYKFYFTYLCGSSFWEAFYGKLKNCEEWVALLKVSITLLDEPKVSSLLDSAQLS